MLAQLNPTTLAEHVGTQFDVINDPANVLSLTLTKVVEHVKAEHYHAFSLFFHGPSNPYMPQATYKLKHAQLGDIELFLVPIAKDKDGFEYEAAFTHTL
jgi:hypothetical protein